MMRRLLVTAAILTLVAVSPLAQDGRRAGVTLQAGMAAEFIEADLPKAITLYERAVAEAGADRELTARGLLALGMALEKVGRVGDARKQLGLVIRDFGDVADVAEVADARLQVLGPGVGITSRDVSATFSGNGRDLSPDGALVAAGKVAGSPPRRELSLVVRDISTGSERALATDLRGPIWHVRFSPDGTRVAALTRVPGDGSGPRMYREDLIVASVQPTGRPPIVLAGEVPASDDWYLRPPLNWLQLEWSPDGRWLPYLAPGANGAFALRLLDVRSGENRSLEVDVSPANGPTDLRWSADATRLAVRVREAATGVTRARVVDVASGRMQDRALSADASAVVRLERWTTRNELAVRDFAQDGIDAVRFRIVDIDDDVERETCAGDVPDQRAGLTFRASDLDYCLEVTPDGLHQLVWRHQSNQLVVRDTRSGRDTVLTRSSGDERFGGLSPDGSLAVFASNREGWWGLYAAALSEAPVNRPTLLRRFEGLPVGIRLTWSRTGLIAVVQSGASDIYRVSVDPETGRATDAPERLTHERDNNLYPRFSPDGLRVAYLATEGVGVGVAVMDASGANEVMLSETYRAQAPQRWAVWARPSLVSPEWRTNQEIVFAAPMPAGSATPNLRQLVSLKPGAEAERLTVLPEVRMNRGVYHTWSLLESTDEVVYLAHGDTDEPGRPHALKARSLADGTERLLGTIPEPGRFVSDFLVSPDGSRVAYVLSDDGACGPCQIGVLSLATGDARVVFEPVRLQPLAAWSGNGRFLLFGASQPRVLDTEGGGAPWNLLNPSEEAPFAPGLVAAWGEDAAGSWSPDSRTIVFHLSRSGNETIQWVGLTRDALGVR